MAIANLVRVTSATTGTGTITLGSAVSGFLTPANAGVVSGQLYSYAIEADYVTVGDDMVPTSREVGNGVIDLVAGTLTRNVVNSTNGNALLNLAGDQQVIICVTTETLYPLVSENLIINGGAEVSQEFGTTAQTGITGNAYIVDMIQVSVNGPTVTVQQVADAPPGFENSAKISVTTSSAMSAAQYAIVNFNVEGFRTARLTWGTAVAQSIAIGFYVKMNRTGTYSGSVRNGGSTRAYPFSFSINVSGTWEYKTVVIPGDTTGTWATNNSTGLILNIAMGLGSTSQGTAGAWVASGVLGVTGTTNGVAATSDYMNITAISIMPGTVPLPQELAQVAMSPFDDELTKCMRYYEKSYDYTDAPGTVTTTGMFVFLLSASLAVATWTAAWTIYFKVSKRAVPTVTNYSRGSGASGKIYDAQAGADVNPTNIIGTKCFYCQATASGTAASVNFQGHWVADARL